MATPAKKPADLTALQTATPPLWLEHFAVAPEMIQRFESAAVLGQDFLFWCLSNGLVNEAAYLTWAAQTYELPFLRNEFFQKPLDPVFWNEFKSLKHWSARCVPLSLWDDVLLIGCAERLPPLEFNGTYRLVLASPLELSKCWQTLSQEAQEAQELTPMPTLEEMAPEGILPFATAAIPDFPFAAAPDGLKPSLTQAIQFAPPPPPPPPPPPKTLDPKSFVLTETKNVAESPQTAIHKDLVRDLDTSKVIDLGSITPPQTDRDPIINNQVPPPLPTLAGSFDACLSFEDATTLAFAKMQSTFDKTMCLIFQGGDLKPWKWNAGFSLKSPGKPDLITLNVPSIFRIVFNTSLPYHGHVMPNDVNKAFFAQTNKSETPQHITIVPILVEKQIAGMLLGATNNEINSRSVLQAMENIAAEVSQAFSRIRANRGA